MSKVFVAPGNGGTTTAGGKVENVTSITTNVDIVRFAIEKNVSLVVVGPEQPLVDGLVDDCRRNRIACFGPTAAAARLEASKAWSKDFMKRNGIKTAKFSNFTDYDSAKAYIQGFGGRVVIKASGLAAGKGVLMPLTTDEAVQAAKQIMIDNIFGEAGTEIVVEEFLEGEEVSVLAFCDGRTCAVMPGAQDHKRIFDGDLGPNTGGKTAERSNTINCIILFKVLIPLKRSFCMIGMGAYAPAPVLTPSLRKQCTEIIQKTIDSMAAEGMPYEGVLYAGFMITKDGPSVLEYNCRFGDPETQVLLPLLESDLYDVLTACVEQRLFPGEVCWKKSTVACTVVCASQGYPGSYRKGDIIKIPHNTGNSSIYHAGTVLSSEGYLETSGGRVLAVTGIGPSISSARRAAYNAVSKVAFDGMQFRKDIGHRALDARVRVGVIGSTRGSSLQPVIDAIEGGILNAQIVVCISNKEDAPILDRARSHSIPAVAIPFKKVREDFDNDVTAGLEEYDVDLILMIGFKLSLKHRNKILNNFVCILGYMRIVSGKFTNRWKNRCINVHPSLLPDFAGGMDLAVHQAVIDAGKDKSGCTVHFVTEEVDGGPIAVQLSCIVDTNDTAETLKAKVQALEGTALIQAIEMFGRNEIGPGSENAETLTYKSSGVDIDAGEALVEAIKPMCKRTRRPGCDADLGGFGGLFDLAAAGYNASETILVSGTDGVGTKLKIAQAVGKHDTIGIDLVAMSVNDILVCGAEPLFFLDYYATGALNVAEAAQVVKGIAEGCFQSSCGLIGGETAEMAGMYAPGEYDLAGFAVGAVKKGSILPRDVKVGDYLIGLPSSGVHSNGYSLVRKCVSASGLKWSDPSPFAEGLSLSDSLLTPTKVYVKTIMPLIKQGKVKGMAHITGGGLLDNLPRVLPEDITADVDMAKSSWELPPVFKWLREISKLPQNEMLRTFNCGIGMVLIVDDVDFVMNSLRISGESPVLLGRLTNRLGDEPQVRVTGEIH